MLGGNSVVRIVDWQHPTKWDDLQYRNFDIAINNRFEPIEAVWAADGKRLFVLFEHGRIARLEWDGAALSKLEWSDEIKSIGSVEQKTPWLYLDLETKAIGDHIDRLLVNLRTSEPKSKGRRVQVDWDHNSSRSGTVEALALDSTLSGGTENRSRFRFSRTLDDTSIDMDRDGTLTLSRLNEVDYSLGLPRCLRASHSVDGKRWSTVHEGGCVLVASNSNGNDGDNVVWQQIRHPFAEVSQAEISPDGLRLAIVGGAVNGPRSLFGFEIDARGSFAATGNRESIAVQFVKWHPTDNELFVLGADNRWSRMDAQGRAVEINCQTRTKLTCEPNFQFVDMQWLCEPTGPKAERKIYLAVLSRAADSSRIDFLSLDEVAIHHFEPIVSRAQITAFAASLIEEILAVGDEKGTLGIGFASPSFDQSPRELYTLPGHRGSKVSQVSFSSDGFSIPSSDTGKKAMQWRSR